MPPPEDPSRTELESAGISAVATVHFTLEKPRPLSPIPESPDHLLVPHRLLNTLRGGQVGLYSLPIGAAVRVKPSVLEPRHSWGQVRPGSVGRVLGTDPASGSQILVNFPEVSTLKLGVQHLGVPEG